MFGKEGPGRAIVAEKQELGRMPKCFACNALMRCRIAA